MIRLPVTLTTLLLLVMSLSGCSMMISSASNQLADSLANGVVQSDDPATVQEGLPAYLLLLDGLLSNSPDDVSLLQAAAKLNSAYAGWFVSEPQRAQRLTSKAFSYARRALCIEQPAMCDVQAMPYQQFQATIKQIDNAQLPVYFVVGSSWAGWIQAHSGNWNAVAELNRVKAIMQRVIELDEAYEQGSAHLYLGVLETLVPPALGGNAELGQHHFEQAIVLSNGDNLMAKVLYAKHYARMMFERQLHDRLLNEVMAASEHPPELRLSNTLAQQLAEQLLADADDYF